MLRCVLRSVRLRRRVLCPGMSGLGHHLVGRRAVCRRGLESQLRHDFDEESEFFRSADSSLDFNGGGPRVGLEGRRYFGSSNWCSVYLKGDISLLLGQMQAASRRESTRWVHHHAHRPRPPDHSGHRDRSGRFGAVRPRARDVLGRLLV